MAFPNPAFGAPKDEIDESLRNSSKGGSPTSIAYKDSPPGAARVSVSLSADLRISGKLFTESIFTTYKSYNLLVYLKVCNIICY